jgi:DNA-binding CsgD family transcriptional regulator
VIETPAYTNAIQYAALVSGDLPAFRPAAKRNQELHARAGDLERLRATFNRAFGFTILGCDGEALALFEELLPELHERHFGSFEMLSLANASLIHARAGRLGAAKSAVERAAGIPSPTTTGPIALAAAALTVGFALWDEDLVAKHCSSDLIEMAFSSHINSTLGRIAGPYARWLFALGEAQKARMILSRAMELLNGPFGATETFIAAAELGDESSRTRAFDYIPMLDSMASAPIYAATAAHLRALRAAHQGDDGDSRALVREACERYEQLGWPLHHAACAQLGGEVKRASAQYRRLHAAGPLRTSRTAAGEGAGASLSEREREIATLVAGGTVNKRIAERLAVNQRTVEKHLTAIYEKLGLRNRSELAAYVSRNLLP